MKRNRKLTAWVAFTAMGAALVTAAQYLGGLIPDIAVIFGPFSVRQLITGTLVNCVLLVFTARAGLVSGAVIGVLSEIGEELARNVVGCAKKLNLRGNVPVVLAGYVWAKGSFNTMFYTFKKHLDAYGDCAFSCEKLRQPPVAGAVIWALEEAKKKQSDRPIAFSRREFLESEAFAKAVY